MIPIILGLGALCLMGNPPRRKRRKAKRRRRNPSSLSGSDLRGLTNAWISPQGDIYWVRDEVDMSYGAPDGVDSHDSWAYRYTDKSELQLERAGWAKIQDGKASYADRLTPAQRLAVERWEEENA